MKTEIFKINPQDIDLKPIKKAAEVIKKGGIAAFPTETVYGLGADFSNEKAIERIFEIKKRPHNRALTVQIPDITYLDELSSDIPAFAYQLMSRFWPGPLTLILKAKGVIAQQRKTIGVRIPDNSVALALLKETSTPLAVPSANISDKPAAKTAEEVLQVFNGLIEIILDAGETKLGVASTVVDLTVTPYKILREGAIPGKDIQGV